VEWLANKKRRRRGGERGQGVGEERWAVKTGVGRGKEGGGKKEGGSERGQRKLGTGGQRRRRR